MGHKLDDGPGFGVIDGFGGEVVFVYFIIKYIISPVKHITINITNFFSLSYLLYNKYDYFLDISPRDYYTFIMYGTSSYM